MSCRVDTLANKLAPMLPPGGSELVDARDAATGMLRAAEITLAGGNWGGKCFHLACNFSAFCDSNQ
jgi:hypothetical protein